MHEPSATSTEAGPHCLNCDYALRGLQDNRCPECGQEFDPRDFLPRVYSDLWTDNRWEAQPGMMSFLHTLLLSWLNPGRLFETYRGYYSDSRSVAYVCVCYALCIATVCAVVSVIDRDYLGEAIACCAIWLIGAGLLQALAAVILYQCLTPVRWARTADYWRAYLRYLAGYLLLSAMLTALALWSIRAGIDLSYVQSSHFVASIGLMVWWLGALSVGIRKGCRRGVWPAIAISIVLLVTSGFALIGECLQYFLLPWARCVY